MWPRPPVDLSVLCWYWHCAVESRHVSAQTFSLKLCLWYIYVDMSHSSTSCTVFTFLVVSRSYDLFRHKKIGCFSWVFKWRTDNLQVCQTRISIMHICSPIIIYHLSYKLLIPHPVCFIEYINYLYISFDFIIFFHP